MGQFKRDHVFVDAVWVHPNFSDHGFLSNHRSHIVFGVLVRGERVLVAQPTGRPTLLQVLTVHRGFGHPFLPPEVHSP